MRAAVLLLALMAGPALAQAPRAPAAKPTSELEATRAELDAARAEVQRLRALAAETAAGRTQLDQCRAKNARLVEIGNSLIASYEQRYGKGQVGPFQLQRARFEAELQATGDEIHQNKADAAPVRPDAAPQQPPQ